MIGLSSVRKGLAAACLLLAMPAAACAQGAAETGVYRNLLAEGPAPHSEAEIDAKLDRYWQAAFAGDDTSRVYYRAAANANGPTAYILDTGNDDIRSEGMSYGMMIAVQMDHKAEFDALWNWTWTHMRHKAGPFKGYFRWQCTPQGCPDDKVPASDGEEYIATALFFAAGRWGNGKGIYDYEAQANAILDVMLHKEDMNGGVVGGATNMFNTREKQIVFVPKDSAARFTDPSYHLPAFYEIWARRAAGWRDRAADRRFWRDAAATSRTFFAKAAHPETALTPDYAEFDGRPKVYDGHEDFRFDAFRSAVNWSVDQAWWQSDPQAVTRTDRLQAFFEGQGFDTYANQYRIDGTPLSSDRSTALIASNGVTSLVATGPHAQSFVDALWALEPPTGKWRYYNGLLQFMSLLHVSGRFRVY